MEILLVDRRVRLANGNFRVLRRFFTKVVPNTDSPYWNQKFDVKSITSTALQLQLILWEDSNKTAMTGKSKCMGHVSYNLSSILFEKNDGSSRSGKDSGSKKFAPRLGRGSHLVPVSELISLPHLHCSRILPGKPAALKDVASAVKVGTLTFGFYVLN